MSPHKNHALISVQLLAFNEIPNADTGKNKIDVGDRLAITPTGGHNIEDIRYYVQNALAVDGIAINIKSNNN